MKINRFFIPTHLISARFIFLLLIEIFSILPSSTIGYAQDNYAPDITTTCEQRDFTCTIELNGKYTYDLQEAPYSEANREAFLEMSELEQKKFLASRAHFLNIAASSLHYTRGLYGVGSIVKNKISKIFSKMSSYFKAASDENTDTPQPIEDLATVIANAENETSDKSLKERVRERSYQLVYNMLKGVDKWLWSQSHVVANQNEIVISGSLSLIGLNGVGSHALGGSAGIGLNLGYNKSSKAFVFEFFSEKDKISYAYTPTVMYGVSPKLGVSFIFQKPGQELLYREGNTFYPPGAPIYLSSMHEMASAGASSSFIAFPPFIGDAFSYLNETKRLVVVRMTFSPRTPGFFRLKLGPLRKSLSEPAEVSCPELLKPGA
ncbi:MAG: hypothetical protein A2Z20_09210 [Bdellovibrionales bacterium RBG_16_40_8]|nr:MAG: hypothetical protein A2Z20_09210 [Bdellovibrionales bacterium RBG_16_40_8]